MLVEHRYRPGQRRCDTKSTWRAPVNECRVEREGNIICVNDDDEVTKR